MLGSDPLAALMGCGIDPRSPEIVWKKYLRALVSAGSAVVILGPDVVAPAECDDSTARALNDLVSQYPPGTRMPAETTGRLAGMACADASEDRVNLRVPAYFRRIKRVLGKELAPRLLESGVVTAAAGLHVGLSSMVSVEVPDARALQQWRDWAEKASGDPYERHTAPTLLLPGGAGIYLFRTAAQAPVPPLSLQAGMSHIESGDAVVPIPPTLRNGRAVVRLGPCRVLPQWLRIVLLRDGTPSADAA